LPLEKPEEDNINIQIQYFGRCLGLFGLRDKDKSCFRLFVELVKVAKEERPISSQELTFRLNLSRGTVVHHLNRLIDAGIVKCEDNRYQLKEASLEHVVDSVDKELSVLMNNLKEIAKKLDEQLGF